jgi:hypothetical protein
MNLSPNGDRQQLCFIEIYPGFAATSAESRPGFETREYNQPRLSPAPRAVVFAAAPRGRSARPGMQPVLPARAAPSQRLTANP